MFLVTTFFFYNLEYMKRIYKKKIALIFESYLSQEREKFHIYVSKIFDNL